MLKSLSIKNFQRARKIKIRFDRYVTVIVGSNDRGKSSVLRCLRWLCTNRPSGKRFISWGRRNCSAVLKLDRTEICRVVGSGKNSYILGGELLKSFRSGVPAEVSKVLRLGSANFQHQHSPYFWFGQSPAQVTKELNKLVDLESIDSIQTYLAKELKRCKILLTDAEKRVQEEKEACQSLAWVLRVAAAFRGLSPQLGGIAFKRAGAARIALILRVAVPHRGRYRNASRAAAGGLAVASLAGELLAERDRLDGLRQTANRLAGYRYRHDATLSALRHIPKNSITDISEFRNAIRRANSAEGELQAIDKKIEKRDSELKKKLNGRCPLCGLPTYKE